MNKILVVGAGQLGSRYIQGLIEVKDELEICVFDINLSSLKIARNRWLEKAGDNATHKITWCNNLPVNYNDLCIAIISTTSENRANIINDISNLFNPKFWIIEKVLAQSETEIRQINESIKFPNVAWVNTPRRLMNFYKEIKSELELKKPLRITKTGCMWGIACNSIHFIDLVSWLTGENIVSVKTEKLHSQWVESKRAGYYEITGELTVNYSKGSVLILQSFLNQCDSNLKIEMGSNDFWLIDEINDVAKGPKNKIIEGKLDLQSEITASLVTNILRNNTSNLPTLEESSRQHIIFLNAMLAHWNYSNNRMDTKVPIT